MKTKIKLFSLSIKQMCACSLKSKKKKKKTADEHTIDLHGAVLRFDDREQSIL